MSYVIPRHVTDRPRCQIGWTSSTTEFRRRRLVLSKGLGSAKGWLATCTHLRSTCDASTLVLCFFCPCRAPSHSDSRRLPKKCEIATGKQWDRGKATASHCREEEEAKACRTRVATWALTNGERVARHQRAGHGRQLCVTGGRHLPPNTGGPRIGLALVRCRKEVNEKNKKVPSRAQTRCGVTAARRSPTDGRRCAGHPLRGRSRCQ